MAVASRWGTVSSPSGMSDGHLRDSSLFDIDRRGADLFAQTGYFANLLEVKNLSWLIAIDTDAR